ncbi:hypothetical protein HF324_33180 [Chitinophaga oryzae]|uniref:Uncharacterized protein n=1 Tax=Chitinophaga oryzae TaxID=2725414 RepID=A0ABX6LQT1_9BACT|nr:hypothetical protein [Chitinophaga oryzae]QJB42446.1 hypothetical protein HF324_33180 [Chitinophaga oryzae]
MAVNIEIKEAYVKDLIDFYVEKQRQIRIEVNNLEEQLKEISAIIMQLRQSSRSTNAEIPLIKGDEVYSEKWPWVRKIMFALRQADAPLSTKQIVDSLSEYEPEFISDRKRVVASVSSTLSVKTDEEFGRVQNDSGENAYYILNDGFENKKGFEDKKQEDYGTIIFGDGDDDLPF